MHTRHRQVEAAPDSRTHIYGRTRARPHALFAHTGHGGVGPRGGRCALVHHESPRARGEVHGPLRRRVGGRGGTHTPAPASAQDCPHIADARTCNSGRQGGGHAGAGGQCGAAGWVPTMSLKYTAGLAAAPATVWSSTPPNRNTRLRCDTAQWALRKAGRSGPGTAVISTGFQHFSLHARQGSVGAQVPGRPAHKGSARTDNHARTAHRTPHTAHRAITACNAHAMRWGAVGVGRTTAAWGWG
jgi:hypothetical protein